MIFCPECGENCFKILSESGGLLLRGMPRLVQFAFVLIAGVNSKYMLSRILFSVKVIMIMMSLDMKKRRMKKRVKTLFFLFKINIKLRRAGRGRLGPKFRSALAYAKFLLNPAVITQNLSNPVMPHITQMNKNSL